MSEEKKYASSRRETSLKAYFAQVTGRKLNLTDKKIALPISVGQAYHEGESFFKTIYLLNLYALKHCDVIVADVLQRHTLQLYDPSLSDREAYKKALLLGDAWVNRHQQEIAQLVCSHQILRWSTWLNSKAYFQRRAEILRLMQEDKVFKLGLDETANTFVTRYQKRTDPNCFSYERAFNACMGYVLEECTIMSLWVSNSYDFEVYPGKRIKAMVLTHERLVKPQAPHALEWLRIHFKEVINPDKIEADKHV